MNFKNKINNNFNDLEKFVSSCFFIENFSLGKFCEPLNRVIL